MTIEQRMERLEISPGKQDDLVKELRDAVTVTAQLEARQGRLVHDHSKWLEEHSRRLEENEKKQEHAQRMRELDKRIADLVSGFGEFMRRNN